MLSLSESDRYLRFGYSASDAQIARYVESIDFLRDEVFGVHNRKLELVAMAHLACAQGRRTAEFGVSVAAAARGRGVGSRLFERAAIAARNRGVDTLVIHALGENTAMLAIARRAGAVVQRTGGEADATLALPPDDVSTHVEALLADYAAQWDYRVRREVRRLSAALDRAAAARFERAGP